MPDLGKAYLPLTKEHRDAANEHLAGMAARGFACTVEEAIVKTKHARKRITVDDIFRNPKGWMK